VHIGSVRQVASVVHIDPSEVSTGQTAKARLRFSKRPELIRVCFQRITLIPES
jgi:hypothetical protein